MVQLEGETYNEIFDKLEDWNKYLKAEKIDFKNLPKGPTP
jgi:hypothetical protein